MGADPKTSPHSQPSQRRERNSQKDSRDTKRCGGRSEVRRENKNQSIIMLAPLTVASWACCSLTSTYPSKRPFGCSCTITRRFSGLDKQAHVRVYDSSRNADTSVAVSTLDAAAFSEGNTFRFTKNHQLFATNVKKGGPERAAQQEQSGIRR